MSGTEVTDDSTTGAVALLLAGLSVIELAETEFVSVFADSGESLVPACGRKFLFAGVGTFLISWSSADNYMIIITNILDTINATWPNIPRTEAASVWVGIKLQLHASLWRTL